METARVFVSGFVQGVGYRQFIKRKALEFNLSGFVRNMPDGRVEALFQGSKKQIDKMILLCRKGPFLSEVKDVSVFWEKINEKFGDFKIIS